MFTGLLIIAIICLLGILSHRNTRLEQKILKNVPLVDWFTILVFPVGLYIGWVLVVENILDRPTVPLFPLEDFEILAITVLFFVYGMVGNALHFTGKVLWRYLQGQKHTTAYQITEMFHNKLGHYLSYLSALFIFAFLLLLEINHPIVGHPYRHYLLLIIIVGILSGVSSSKAVLDTSEWFGGYNKPLFFVVGALLILLLSLFKTLHLRFSLYPVSIFIISMFAAYLATFAIRQFFIFARLGKKRRLRFLAKILSV